MSSTEDEYHTLAIWSKLQFEENLSKIQCIESKVLKYYFHAIPTPQEWIALIFPG